MPDKKLTWSLASLAIAISSWSLVGSLRANSETVVALTGFASTIGLLTGLIVELSLTRSRLKQTTQMASVSGTMIVAFILVLLVTPKLYQQASAWVYPSGQLCGTCPTALHEHHLSATAYKQRSLRVHRIVKADAVAAGLLRTPSIVVLPFGFQVGGTVDTILTAKPILLIGASTAHQLTDPELKAVMGHEIGHILAAQHSKSLATVLIRWSPPILLASILILYAIGIFRPTKFFLSGHRRQDGLVASVLGCALLTCLTVLNTAAVLRQGELRADQEGARLAGTPLYMAEALVALTPAQCSNTKLNIGNDTLFLDHPTFQARLTALKISLPTVCKALRH